MANDDRQSDHFIREVDEELRRAQLKSIWDRFAPLIVGACLLIVAVTAGYRGWLWYQERQAAQAGDRFMTALQALEGEDPAQGEATLAAIAEESSGGYSVLARLRLAGAKGAGGDNPAALAAYDQIAADEAVSDSFRSLARMRAALLALDSGDLAGARERATPLNEPGSPWRHAAREVLGMAAYQAADLPAARELFTAIQQDAETPPELWVRSGMMVGLIDGQLAAPGTEAPAPAAPVEPAAATPAAAPEVPAAQVAPAGPSNPPAPELTETTEAGPAPAPAEQPGTTGGSEPAPVIPPQ